MEHGNWKMENGKSIMSVQDSLLGSSDKISIGSKSTNQEQYHSKSIIANTFLEQINLNKNEQCEEYTSRLSFKGQGSSELSSHQFFWEFWFQLL